LFACALLPGNGASATLAIATSVSTGIYGSLSLAYKASNAAVAPGSTGGVKVGTANQLVVVVTSTNGKAAANGGMSGTIDLDGGAANADGCVFVSSNAPNGTDISAATLSWPVTFATDGSLTADGPYLYCSALTAGGATISASITTANLKGNAMTNLAAVPLTAYAVPDPPTAVR
jgi:hypothetical protein